MRNPGWAGTAAGAALIAVALAVTACGAGSVSSAGGAYGYGTQTTQATRAGTVLLADNHGLTLYYYSADKRGSGKSVCTGGCATAWPPLAAPVKAPAGVRLPGPLGIITRPGGLRQVTINGLPIYLYAGDKAPGQETGNGMAGSWHVIKIHATAAAGRGAALKVSHTRVGPVLASSHGRTLYYYSADKRHSGKSACTGTCATAWPPLAAPVKAPAGGRLPGKLGVITRPGGLKQVTLNGYPLYFYIGDKTAGQVTGNGIGGAWHVIKIKA